MTKSLGSLAIERRQLHASPPSGLDAGRPAGAARAGVARALGALALAGLAACASRPDAASTGGGSVDAGATAEEVSCALHAPGCACEPDGLVESCGVVRSRAADDVTCDMGHRACAGGRFTPCSNESTAHVRASSAGASPENLAATAVACTGNPCDPLCTGFDDTASGISPAADSGIVATADGGLALTPQVGTAAIPCTGLSATPTSATVTVTGIASNGALTLTTNPSPLAFAATFSPGTCYSGNAPAVWQSSKPAISSVDSAGTFRLVEAVPGTITITGYSGGFNTSAAPSTVTVVVAAVDTTSAPSGYTAASFTGATSGADPWGTMLYPYDGTVLPLGLLPPVIQWDNGSHPAAAVKVKLYYPADGSKFTWSGIVPESQTQPTPTLTGQPRAFIPQNVWTAFERAAQGQDAYFSVQRIVGSTLYNAMAARKIHFANGQLKGTVYYNSYGTNLATNYCCTAGGANFGGATLKIPPLATTPSLVAGDNTNCRVCHSVAANGGRLVTELGSNYSATAAYDLVAGTNSNMSPTDGRFAWGALSPDGTYLFSNSGTLAGASTSNSAMYAVPGGASITVSGLPAFAGSTPVFANDASHVAAHWRSGTVSGTAGDDKSLVALDYVPGTKTFSNFRKLVTPTASGTGSGKAYWPTFLPSNDRVVYQLETRYNGRDPGETRSGCDSSGTCSNEGAHGELWWVDLATKTASRMDKANGVGTLPAHSTTPTTYGDDATLNYEPTVNPAVVGGYAWVVFTSRRRYGNIATINGFWSDPRYHDISAQPTTKKLWVAAIDPSVAAGSDPSFPAFYLPGQELLAGNSRGYWVLDTCKQPGAPSASTACTSDLDCCPAAAGQPANQCVLDSASATTKHCQATAAVACKADGQACSTSSDCCQFPVSGCISNVCAPPATVYSYYPSTFTRDFDGSGCPAGKHVEWHFFGLKAATNGVAPNDWSHVDMTVRTATTAAGLSTATPVTLGSLSGPPADQTTYFTEYDVNSVLKAASQLSQNYLRVTMSLQPAPSAHYTPVIVAWHQQFDCVDAQ